MTKMQCCRKRKKRRKKNRTIQKRIQSPNKKDKLKRKQVNGQFYKYFKNNYQLLLTNLSSSSRLKSLTCKVIQQQMGFFGVGNEKNYNPLFILCVWLEISLEGPMIIKKYKRKLKILAFDLGKLCQKAYKKDKFELGFMPKVFSDFINYKDESQDLIKQIWEKCLKMLLNRSNKLKDKRNKENQDKLKDKYLNILWQYRKKYHPQREEEEEMKEENEGEYEGRMIRDDAEEERRDAIKTINGMIEEIGPLSISQSLRKDWSVLF